MEKPNLLTLAFVLAIAIAFFFVISRPNIFTQNNNINQTFNTAASCSAGCFYMQLIQVNNTGKDFVFNNRTMNQLDNSFVACRSICNENAYNITKDLYKLQNKSY